jgi:uncharacterized membrane protein YeaQ/YmgE (transglycosylase-associated protein family)
MEILILVGAMLAVGLIVGWLAGPIWKGNRPYGVRGDLLASAVTAVAVGLMDWYVIPAMGFSETMKLLGVALEPALGSLIVLWILRRAKR